MIKNTKPRTEDFINQLIKEYNEGVTIAFLKG